MPTVGVGAGGDVVKDRQARLLRGGERLAGEERALQAGEEGRGDGVVIAIPDCPEGGQDPRLGTAGAIGQRVPLGYAEARP